MMVKLDFLPNDKLQQDFTNATSVIATSFLLAIDRIMKSRGSGFIKKSLFFTGSHESNDLYASIFGGGTFKKRVERLKASILAHGQFFVPVNIGFAIGVVLFDKNDPILVIVNCYKDEAVALLKPIFKALEKEGYGTFNPSDLLVEKYMDRKKAEQKAKELKAEKVREEVKAFLSQPSPNYF